MHRTSAVCAATLLIALLLSGCSTDPDTETLGALTMAPGSTTHMLLQLDGADQDTTLVVIDDGGLDIQLPEALHSNETGGAAGWLGIAAGADAETGTHDVVLEAPDGRQLTVEVVVEVPDEALEEGAIALVEFTIRAADGAIGATTQTEVDRSPLPRLADYQAPQAAGPQQLLLSPQQLPPDLLESLIGAGVGHSITVEIPEFFGPTSQEQDLPRKESMPRTDETERFFEMARSQAEQEGLIDNGTQEGDALQVGGPIPYQVETLNETMMRAEVDLQEGDTVTLQERWPDATVVETISDASVRLRTDPPVSEGEPFTWNDDWPEATEIISVNETVILLRHSPEEGLTYTTPTQQGEARITVASVGDETITVSQENPHPMAGETGFVEVTVVGEEDAPEQAVPGGPQSG